MVEALSSGTPVIGFRRASVPEVIEDGRTGFIVDDLDGMVEAIGRIGEIDRRACRASAETRFTVARMVDDVEAMYRLVLERVAGTPVGVQPVGVARRGLAGRARLAGRSRPASARRRSSSASTAPLAPGPVVDRDVVRQPRPLQGRAEGGSVGAERLAEKGPGILDRVERPEAMDHPDPEAVRQERSGPAGPRAVLRQVPAQARDVVAAVVVDDEQAAARAEDPIGGGELVGLDAAEGRPGADDRVGRVLGERPRVVAEQGSDARDARPGGGQPGQFLGAPAHEDDLAPGERAERLEGAIDLALAIEGGRQHGRAR